MWFLLRVDLTGLSRIDFNVGVLIAAERGRAVVDIALAAGFFCVTAEPLMALLVRFIKSFLSCFFYLSAPNMLISLLKELL